VQLGPLAGETRMRMRRTDPERVLIAIPLAGLGAGTRGVVLGPFRSGAMGLWTGHGAGYRKSRYLDHTRLLAGRIGGRRGRLSFRWWRRWRSARVLAGVIVAIMYPGGQSAGRLRRRRAERDLKALIDRAPRFAHRKSADTIEDVPIDKIVVWDAILVRGRRGRPDRWENHQRRGHDRASGADGRAYSSLAAYGRLRQQWHDQRRRDL